MFTGTRFIISACSVICTFTSCGTYRYVYAASAASNPYFKEKNESKLTAWYSSSKDDDPSSVYARGFDVQGAYAISNHWALTAGYFNRNEKDHEWNQGDILYKRNLFDIGGGYYFALKRGKSVYQAKMEALRKIYKLGPPNKITANLYAGFAFGKFSFDQSNWRHHESVINKWFIQPSINFMPGEYVRFSIVTKISFVHYGNIQTNYTLAELQDFSLDQIVNKTLIFAEPSFNFQFGIPAYPWVKIDAVFTLVISSRFHNSDLVARSSNASIGLNFDFSKLKRKKGK